MTIIRVINSRGMRWGSASIYGRNKNAYKILVGKYKGRHHMEDPDVDASNRNGAYGRGLDSSGSGYGSVASSYEHGNERLGSIKGGEFLD